MNDEDGLSLIPNYGLLLATTNGSELLPKSKAGKWPLTMKNGKGVLCFKNGLTSNGYITHAETWHNLWTSSKLIEFQSYS